MYSNKTPGHAGGGRKNMDRMEHLSTMNHSHKPTTKSVFGKATSKTGNVDLVNIEGSGPSFRKVSRSKAPTFKEDFSPDGAGRTETERHLIT
jgi:hypothetical protein